MTSTDELAQLRGDLANATWIALQATERVLELEQRLADVELLVFWNIATETPATPGRELEHARSLEALLAAFAGPVATATERVMLRYVEPEGTPSGG